MLQARPGSTTQISCIWGAEAGELLYCYEFRTNFNASLVDIVKLSFFFQSTKERSVFMNLCDAISKLWQGERGLWQTSTEGDPVT